MGSYCKTCTKFAACQVTIEDYRANGCASAYSFGDNLESKSDIPDSPLAPNRSLGPVKNFEQYLKTDWYNHIFNELYLKTDGDVVENEANTKDDIKMLLQNICFVKNDNVLDLCCGQGRHSLELAKLNSFNITGVDSSEFLLNVARQRAENPHTIYVLDENLSNVTTKSSSIEFIKADARTIELPNELFDTCICMGNSFGYFEKSEDDLKVLKNVNRMLKPNGQLALELVDGEWMKSNFEQRSWEWIDEKMMVCRERELAKDGERLISREVIINTEKGVIADQFYAERLYTKEKLKSILKEAGFRNIEIKNIGASVSARNQDLGMMGKMILVTGIKG